MRSANVESVYRFQLKHRVRMLLEPNHQHRGAEDGFLGVPHAHRVVRAGGIYVVRGRQGAPTEAKPTRWLSGGRMARSAGAGAAGAKSAKLSPKAKPQGGTGRAESAELSPQS